MEFIPRVGDVSLLLTAPGPEKQQNQVGDASTNCKD